MGTPGTTERGSRAWFGLRLLLAGGLLTQTSLAQQFEPAQSLSMASPWTSQVHAADLNGDGHQDVIFSFSSFASTEISWYENFDGLGGFANPREIASYLFLARDFVVADLDGDDDQDVIATSGIQDQIVWIENTDGEGSFGPQYVIGDAPTEPVSVFAADLDGDGDMDVLSAGILNGHVAWYENADGLGTFGPTRIITLDVEQPSAVFVKDLDGDGDADVLCADFGDDEIVWFVNMDGAGTFGSKIVITTQTDGPTSVFAYDLDGDGDADVLSTSRHDDKIAWYENTDGAGAFGPQLVITDQADGAYSVVTHDLDGDGDPDVLATSDKDDTVAWFENTDGAGAFGPERIITTLADQARSATAADLDGDGDADVLSASGEDFKVAVYENADGQGNFGPQELITSRAKNACAVFAADLDGDGDREVLSASYGNDRLAWYPNTDGGGTFGPQRIVTDQADRPQSIVAADLDGDGDADVLGRASANDTVAWYENVDGQGGFGPARLITNLADGAWTIIAADLDGDGDEDVLSASWKDDKIAWYENTDGAGTFGPQLVITSLADSAYSVFARDVDGDGDVLSASRSDGKVAWYENTDGSGIFGPQQVIAVRPASPLVVFAEDLDGDADPDVLYGGDSGLEWFENLDGLGSFGPGQVLDTPSVEEVFVVDVDSDGDSDVLANGSWYENTDALGTFGPARILPGAGSTSVHAADFDGDGDPDVVTTVADDDRIVWSVNGIRAAAAFRNAGSNPASHDAVTLPVLGTTYTAAIDLGGTTGHSLAWLVGFATPLRWPLASGQVLLVNFADPNGELLGQAYLPGPVATFDLPVPSDLSLLDYELSTQALHVGGVQPFAVSNARDLRLGFQ